MFSSWFSKFKLSDSKKRFVGLNAAQFFSYGVSLVNSVIIARMLGAEDFGLYALVFAVVGFLVIFFRFGFFSSISVLLANEEDEHKKREIIGAGHLIAILIGLSFALVIALVSLVVDLIFGESVGYILILLVPFLIFSPFANYVVAIGHGTGQVRCVAVDYLGRSCLFFVSLLLLFYFESLDLISVSLAQVATYSLVVAIVFFMMKPAFSNLKVNLALIWEKNKAHGFHLYVGQIADQATFRSDEVMIPMFAAPVELGFYKIANTITTALTLPARNLAQIKYKSFANFRGVDTRLFLFLVAFLFAEVIFFILFFDEIIDWIYGEDFSEAYVLSLYLLPVLFFGGMSKLHNAYLGANSCGKIMRNTSFCMMIVNLIGNFALIPPFGAVGAAVSSGIAMTVFCFMTLYFYRKVEREAAHDGVLK